MHFSGSCYKVFPSKVKRQAAYEQCQSVGAHLVTLKSASEQDFVTSAVLFSPSGMMGLLWSLQTGKNANQPTRTLAKIALLCAQANDGKKWKNNLFAKKAPNRLDPRNIQKGLFRRN